MAKKKKGNDDNEVSDILKEKEKFYAEEDLSPEVKSILDDVFAEMVGIEAQNETIIASEDSGIVEIKEKPKKIIIETKKNLASETLEPSLEKRIKELEKQVEEYHKKIQEIEDKELEYEEKIKVYEQKSKTIEETKREFEERSKLLDESRKEFEERGKKLQEARETFMQLSKQLEEKKTEIHKRETNISRMQKTLEQNWLKFEEDKKAIEKIKQKYKTTSSEIGFKSKELAHDVYPNQYIEGDNWSSDETSRMEKGKVDVLQDILQELLYQGGFQSCFLIDGKGMIIAEYSKTEFDSLAIGAMFSLIITSVLRTVKNLSLNELEYFKLSSVNGEFLVRNIEIAGYERNLILLAYYDESDSVISNHKQTLSKKTIKNILKSVKKDFYEYRKGLKISWAFDNLADKVDFLKQKYGTIDGNIELIRTNLLNKGSLKIMELFEK